MIHEHGDIVMVEVADGAMSFELWGNTQVDTLRFMTMPKPGKFKAYRIGIPPAESYTIVGLSSKLSEDEWRGIVENLHHYVGFEAKPCYPEYPYLDSWCNTATESGLSLLKSKNLSPDTTLILKKQNSKI